MHDMFTLKIRVKLTYFCGQPIYSNIYQINTVLTVNKPELNEVFYALSQDQLLTEL